MRTMHACAVGSITALLYACPAAAQPAAPVDCVGDFQGTRARGNVRLNLDCDFAGAQARRAGPRARYLRGGPRYYEDEPYYGRRRYSRPFLQNDYNEEILIERRYSRPRTRVLYTTVYDEAPGYGGDWDWCPLGFLFNGW